MISIIRNYLIVYSCILFLAGCSEGSTDEPKQPDTPQPEDTVSEIHLSILSGANIEAGDLQGTYRTILKTNASEWSAVCPPLDTNWCKTTQKNDTLQIFLKDNFTGTTRSTVIDVIAKNSKNSKRESVTVTQIGVERSGSLYRGTLNNIVIFYRFANDPEFDKDLNYYELLLNGGGDKPSMQGFFNEASYGKFRVRSHFFPKTKDTKVLSFQSQDTKPSGDDFIWNPGYYVAQALDSLKSEIETALSGEALDANNDGKVDNITFVLYSCGYTSFTSFLGGSRTLNGKECVTYNVISHRNKKWADFSHEFFHSLGAPDLYHITSGSNYVGEWDIMSSPTEECGHMGAYLKWKYSNHEWVEDIPLIHESGHYVLNKLNSKTSENVAYMLPTKLENEFFVLEFRNRRNSDYETNLPGSGLLVYRINTKGNGNYDDYAPKEVYLLRPSSDIDQRLGRAFFSLESGRTALNQYSDPKLQLSDGSLADFTISNISSSKNDQISFEITFLK